jgi:hypothetical protein
MKKTIFSFTLLFSFYLISCEEGKMKDDNLLSNNDRDSLYPVRTISKYGIIGYDGKILVRPEWDSIQVDSNNRIFLKKDQYLSPVILLKDSSRSNQLPGFSKILTNEYSQNKPFQKVMELPTYKAFIIRSTAVGLLYNDGESVSKGYDFISKNNVGRFFFAVKRNQSNRDSSYRYLAFLLNEKGELEHNSLPMQYKDSSYSVNFILTKKKCYDTAPAINILYYRNADISSFKYFEESGNIKSFSQGFHYYFRDKVSSTSIDWFSSNNCLGFSYFLGKLIGGLIALVGCFLLFFALREIWEPLEVIAFICALCVILDLIITLVRLIYQLF